jgi:4-hydroxy-2,2'-bipyrrole-5-methanol dehydrogenase
MLDDIMTVTLEAIQTALKKAILAPSSHNCQPWSTVVIEGDEAKKVFCEQNSIAHTQSPIVVFGLHRQRVLVTLPTHAIEMHLSCGAYIQAFLESLDEPTLPSIAWVADQQPLSLAGLPDWPDYHQPLLAIAWDNPDSKKRPCYASFLSTRHTHRLEFESNLNHSNDPGTPTFTSQQRSYLLEAQALLDPDNHAQLECDLIEDKKNISTFGDFISRHASIEFTHQAAWQETYRYFRWTPQQGDTTGDGFLLSQVMGPLPKWLSQFYRGVMSPTLMSVLSKLGLANSLAKQLGKKFKASPALYTLSFKDEQPSVRDQVLAGMKLLDFWLRAESQGLSLWPASIVLQHDSIRHALQKEMKFPGRVYFIGKIGIAKNRQDVSLRHFDSDTVTVIS